MVIPQLIMQLESRVGVRRFKSASNQFGSKEASEGLLFLWDLHLARELDTVRSYMSVNEIDQ